MSNPTVSFRISDYHLARGLRAIRHLEPAWKLTTTSDLIRTIFNDYIAKSEFNNNDPLNVTPELLQEIIIARTMTKQSNQFTQLPQLKKTSSNKSAQQIQRELEEERIFYEIKHREMEKANQIRNAQLTESQLKEIDEQIARSNQIGKRILHEAPQELETDSVINTVNDFSPPKEWIE